MCGVRYRVPCSAYIVNDCQKGIFNTPLRITIFVNIFPTSSGSRLSCSCSSCSRSCGSGGSGGSGSGGSGSGGGGSGRSGGGGSSYIYVFNRCDIVPICDVPHIDFGLDVDIGFMSIAAFKAQF